MRVLLWIGGGLAGLGVAGWLGASVWISNFYWNALPEQLGWGGLVSEQTSGFAFMEACGGVVYPLDRATTAQVRARGLAFLDDGAVGRAYVGSRQETYYTWREWRPTPVPPGLTSDGWWPGLSCMDRATARRVWAAATRPGAYWVERSESLLIIIPSEGVAVMTFFG